MNFYDLKINFIRFILAILIIFFLLLSFGINPLDVTNALFIGSFGSFEKIIRTILVWVPISLASIALIYTFSSGMWNIGIEGQIIMGAIGATFIARSFLGDNFISPYIQLIMALGFGGFWGFICAILKVKGGVHEIFSGLGLDFVASGIAIYLIIGPWKRKGIASTSGTEIFHESSWIPTVGSLDFPIFLLLLKHLLNSNQDKLLSFLFSLKYLDIVTNSSVIFYYNRICFKILFLLIIFKSFEFLIKR